MVSGNKSNELLAQGVENLKQGNFTLAKKYLVESASHDPKNVQAIYFLGITFIQENQISPALDCLLNAVKLEPDNLAYLLNLANLQSKSGHLKDAVSNYLLYLQKQPNSSEVLFYLACTLMQAKKFEDAIQVFYKSIAVNPKALLTYMTLADLQYKLLKYNDSLSTYIKALDQGFIDKNLFISLHKLYVEKGNITKAKDVLYLGIKHYPNDLAFWYRLSKIDNTCLNTDLKNIIDYIDDEQLSNEGRVYKHFLEAQFASKQGNVDLELSQLLSAHKLYAEYGIFDKPSSYYLSELPKKLTNKAPTNEGSFKSLTSTSPVFIIGVPRSGSTLVENILCSGKEKVAKGEETGAFSNALYKLKDKNFSWLDFENEVKKILTECSLLNDEARFSDKSLENIFLVDHILTLFPNAKIIYCDRSPLSSIVSILKNNMTYLPWAHNLDSILEYFNNCYKAIDHWNKKYKDKIFTIKYETLIASPEQETKSLFEFCDLKWEKSCLDFYLKDSDHCRTASNIQIREKINDKSVSLNPKYTAYFQSLNTQYEWLN